MTGMPRFAVIVILLLAAQGCAAGAGSREETITLTGTIRVVGNEPFTRLVLTVPGGKEKDGAGRDYLLTGPLTGELRRHHQGEVVALEGSRCTPPSPRFTHCFTPGKVTIINPR